MSGVLLCDEISSSVVVTAVVLNVSDEDAKSVVEMFVAGVFGSSVTQV